MATFNLTYTSDGTKVPGAIADGTIKENSFIVIKGEDNNAELQFLRKKADGVLKFKEDSVILDITVPSIKWNLQHNLGKQYPDIMLLDSDGNTIFGDIDYNTKNLAIVTFSQAIAGKAVIK